MTAPSDVVERPDSLACQRFQAVWRGRDGSSEVPGGLVVFRLPDPTGLRYRIEISGAGQRPRPVSLPVSRSKPRSQVRVVGVCRSGGFSRPRRAAAGVTVGGTG